jgi:sugar lactone lactonase YvrE
MFRKVFAMRSLAVAALFALSLAACTKASSPANEAPTLPHPELLASFDAAAGELPEGLAMGEHTAFVGFAPTSRIVKVDPDSGAVSAFGQLPAPVAGKGFMTGLALASDGDLYAGLASFTPEVQAGIYRVSKGGGAATLFAKDAELGFPNGLAFDADGALFATDSGSGSIFRIDPSGTATRWSSDPALSGNKDACDGAGPGFAIGANGLVVERDAIYVVNLDQATLVKLQRQSDGTAGEAVVLAGPDCDSLGGADGLARSPDGSFVIAVNRQNKLVRVAADGAVHTLASGAPFDFPATVAYRESTLFATNFALANASAGKPATPGLLRIGETL